MNLDLTTLRTNLYPPLHATGPTDLVFFTDAELLRLFGDHLKRIALGYGVFVVRDITSITLVAGTAVYTAPTQHLSTLHVAVANRPMVASSTHELEMKDDAYQTTAATTALPMRRWYSDKQGPNKIGFHPVPAAADVGGTTEVIYHKYPCTDNSTAFEAPAFLGDWLEAEVLADSYAKESDIQCPEVAQSARSLAMLYQQAAKQYWIPAQ